MAKFGVHYTVNSEGEAHLLTALLEVKSRLGSVPAKRVPHETKQAIASIQQDLDAMVRGTREPVLPEPEITEIHVAKA